MRRDPEHHVEIDAAGLACPWPVIRLRRTLDGDLPPGKVVKIVASEREARRDFATFCDRTGHQLLHSRLEPGRGIAFFIRK
jgi:tRNA 2-thiouridine synthesizing protein A